MDRISNRSGQLFAKNDDIISELLNDPKYEIRSNGLIYRKNHIGGFEFWVIAGYERHKNILNRNNYASLHYNYKKLSIHRIIWAKYGSAPLAHDLVINHINGNTLDNRIDNLELVTQSTNNIHQYRSLGRKPTIGNKKISQELAHQIRAEQAAGMTNRALRQKYGLAKSTISYIVNSRTWK